MKSLIYILSFVFLLSACGMQNSSVKVDNVEVSKDTVKVDNVEVNKNTTKVDEIELKNNPEADEVLKVVDEVLGE